MSSGAIYDELVMFEEPTKLRKLAKLILHQEEALQVWMKSEPERMAYLDNCNNSYDGVTKLIDDTENLMGNHKGSNEETRKIVKDIRHYIHYGINMNLQCIRNCSLRVTCVNKIGAHFADLVKVVEELKPGDVAAARRLAEEVTLYKEYMWEYSNSCRNASARGLSKIFSRIIKQEGISFEDLVKRSKNKNGFAGEFEELEEVEKLRVYKTIIEESGRVKVPLKEKITGSIGVAVLVATAALIAFDIYEAEYKLEAAIRDTLNLASDIGSFAVQLAVEGALLGDAEFNVSGLFLVYVSGFIAASVAGLIFTAASGALLDLIFSSGGKVEQHKIGMQFHKLEPPDGMAIAYEMSHDI
ncbi:hypothetical protein vseg_011387 [Gypsophila vaccaria]